VPNSWNVHKSGSEDAIDLVSTIHVMLSERDDRLLNKSELRNRLLSLLQPETVTLSVLEVPQIVSSFGSSAPATLLSVAAQS